METNLVIKKDSSLHTKGKALLLAAYEYWKEYSKLGEPSAVVFLEDDSGHFVLFTRSEYRREIMSVIDNMGEEPLVHPFET